MISHGRIRLFGIEYGSSSREMATICDGIRYVEETRMTMEKNTLPAAISDFSHSLFLFHGEMRAKCTAMALV